MVSFTRWAMRAVDFPELDPRFGVIRVVFEQGPVDEMLERFSATTPIPVEMRAAGAKRKAEFLAGRTAAAMALSRCGCATPYAVGRKADGSPSWPRGFIGSITHGAGIVGAAVAPQATCEGLGIDAESVISRSAEGEVAPSVLTASELASARAGLPDLTSPSLVTLAFSAKESLYKCLHPIVGEFFEFRDVELASVRADPPTGDRSTRPPADAVRSGEFRLVLRRPLGARFGAGWAIVGRFAFEGDRVKTALSLTRPHAFVC